MYQIWCQSVQQFDSFSRLLNLWPPSPPPRNASCVIEGRLVFSLFPDESADVNQSWCQSVQPFESFPRLLNVWPPKNPQVPPCVSRGNLFGISIPRWICTCVPNLVPIGSAVWQLPRVLNMWPTKKNQNAPRVLRGELYLAYVHVATRSWHDVLLPNANNNYDETRPPGTAA